LLSQELRARGLTTVRPSALVARSEAIFGLVGAYLAVSFLLTVMVRMSASATELDVEPRYETIRASAGPGWLARTNILTKGTTGPQGSIAMERNRPEERMGRTMDVFWERRFYDTSIEIEPHTL